MMIMYGYSVKLEKLVVVLPDLFHGMGAWRNSMETQQLGHAPRSGPEVKKWKK